jgi:hypothetical protein
MKLIDAFGHVGLPRYLGAEEYLRVMDDNEVEAALLSPSAMCPDLVELSRAATRWPNRLRSVGLALGEDRGGVLDSVKAQLDSGFVGIRLHADQIVAWPELLELHAQYAATPVVLGPDLFGPAALLVCDFLDRHPARVALAPHFAGLPSPAAVDELPHARRLLEHPRFLVVFSRQGVHDPLGIARLARFFVESVGWQRLMWGSEFPVCLWRDESYRSTVGWIERIGLTPTEAQKRAFYRGNAEKHLFGHRQKLPTRIDPSQGLMELRKPSHIFLFPRNTLELPEETHRTLLLNYLNRGRDLWMPYADYIAQLLIDVARRMEG